MATYRDQYRTESARLSGWDYASAGYYFVTICTINQRCFFGDILEGLMCLSPIGQIVAEEWQKTPSVRPNVLLDQWAVMPNHLHGIIILVESSQGDRTSVAETSRQDVYAVQSGLKSGSLGAIIGQIKSICTKRIWAGGHRDFAWQCRFYDHIIRDEESLNRIRRYIVDNPAKWSEDRYNPARWASQRR